MQNLDLAFRRRAVLAVIVAALAAAGFWPVVRNGFAGYDDNEYVTENPRVHTGLTSENVRWAFTAVHANNWHPLTWISHQADSTVFGLNPAGHHAVSLAFHVANAVLLFWWLAGLTGAAGRSAFVALVFAVHPLHVESVSWIAERKDVLSTFFGLLTLLAWAGYVRKPGAFRYLVATFLFAASLLSKPMLVTLPVLLAAPRLMAPESVAFGSWRSCRSRPSRFSPPSRRCGLSARVARSRQSNSCPYRSVSPTPRFRTPPISRKPFGRPTLPSSIPSR